MKAKKAVTVVVLISVVMLALLTSMSAAITNRPAVGAPQPAAVPAPTQPKAQTTPVPAATDPAAVVEVPPPAPVPVPLAEATPASVAVAAPQANPAPAGLFLAVMGTLFSVSVAALTSRKMLGGRIGAGLALDGGV